jgi:hypothetical protein
VVFHVRSGARRSDCPANRGSARGAGPRGFRPGKLVVTLERSRSEDILPACYAIRAQDGVLSAALVYQCVDSLDAMNEEIADADRERDFIRRTRRGGSGAVAGIPLPGAAQAASATAGCKWARRPAASAAPAAA